MTYCVRTVIALNLRVGDTVIPDHGPHRRVTLHRLEGAHPVVVVQYEGVPGSSVYYPPSMPLLVEADGSGPECRSSRRIPRPAVQTPSQTNLRARATACSPRRSQRDCSTCFGGTSAATDWS